MKINESDYTNSWPIRHRETGTFGWAVTWDYDYDENGCAIRDAEGHYDIFFGDSATSMGFCVSLGEFETEEEAYSYFRNEIEPYLDGNNSDYGLCLDSETDEFMWVGPTRAFGLGLWSYADGAWLMREIQKDPTWTLLDDDIEAAIKEQRNG